MARPKIKDIVVVANLPGDDAPVAEAPRRGEVFLPMNSAERTEMEARLFRQISNLMDEANTTHLANCKLPEPDQVDPDYITRLSTNEFFFYTQEPLTLEEFERLQNKIADKATTLPSGVQLVLGSFAVKNEQNQVMNVTPHITCGTSPSMHFIIKNNTSPIDVRYKVPTEDDTGDALEVFDASKPHMVMPEINVHGVAQACVFNGVIL